MISRSFLYYSNIFFSSFLVYKNEKLQKYKVNKTTENEYVKQWLKKMGKIGIITRQSINIGDFELNRNPRSTFVLIL